MPSKGKSPDAWHPKIVGHLESLSAEEAAKFGLHEARELVVISHRAGWIRNVSKELFPGSGGRSDLVCSHVQVGT